MLNKATKVARELRRKSTTSEKIFWDAVRNRKVLNRKFNRQFPIHFEYDGIKRFFIADFYCHEKNLIVEIDGGIHEKQKDYDKLRTAIINELGLKVIRFKNELVKNNLDEVIESLKRYL
ncbi:MAG: endonuclease domain-containing protein [Ignavibacteria bacterium]|nr:endonuclease domain-containing protein [Ignavibacteria bacterium]